MNTSFALEQISHVQEFQRKHRVALLTLLFTDIVGSTKLKQRLGDRDAMVLIQRHHAQIRETLRQFDLGEEISTAGDSFFIVFTKPSDAVKFALRVQARLRKLEQETEQSVRDRIGIHVGEVWVAEANELGVRKDLYGIQVDSCARVASLACADQILMTRFAFESARQVLTGGPTSEEGELSWLNHGLYSMKGVDAPVEVFEVGVAGQAALHAPEDSPKAYRVTDNAKPSAGSVEVRSNLESDDPQLVANQSALQNETDRTALPALPHRGGELRARFRGCSFTLAFAFGLALVAGVTLWPRKPNRLITEFPSSPPATPGVIYPATPAPPYPIAISRYPDERGDAEPPPMVKGEEKINLSINWIVKAEVLKRIDVGGIITPANDKLYNSVSRARKMGLVVTVPFGKGKTALAPADIQALKAELERPELMSLRSDPMAVFVILGYADPKGDAKMNLAYSRTRADVVVTAMKRDCGVENVVHAVAMGGSTLLDAQKLEKNRIAEVWVFLP